MKTIFILFALLIMAGSVQAMTDKEAGYIAGIEDGYELGYLAHSGLGNATAAQMFNQEVASYNAYLEGIGGQEYKLAALPMPDLSYMPEFLRNYQGTDPWAGTQVAPEANRHKIDGEKVSYTTGDVNSLPNTAIEDYAASEKGKTYGAEYLGGV